MQRTLITFKRFKYASWELAQSICLGETLLKMWSTCFETLTNPNRLPARLDIQNLEPLKTLMGALLQDRTYYGGYSKQYPKGVLFGIPPQAFMYIDHIFELVLI